ncbi:HAD-IA family hydrolase [Myxococcota bacterium]|nr:HAD-IA family hydrolase [Myxococcota bacterium]
MILRGVLFDATGTLIEPREPAGRTYSRMARHFGVEISEWRMGDAFARILRQAPLMLFSDEATKRIPALERDWWRQVVRSTIRAADSTVRFEDFDRFFDELFAHYAAADAWHPRAGSLEVLRLLRQASLQTGIVSNFDHRLQGILQGLGFSGLLDCVVTPSQARSAKPAAAIFESALEALGLTARETVFVGDDDERDLTGAANLGMRAIDVRGLATLLDLPASLGLE